MTITADKNNTNNDRNKNIVVLMTTIAMAKKKTFLFCFFSTVDISNKVGTSGAYSLRIPLRNSSAPAVKGSKALR